MSLLAEIRHLIDAARQRVAASVNAELTLLYWQIGRRINADVLQGKRAEYGQQVVAVLAQQLTVDYGRSFEEKNLRRMMQFAHEFPDEQIVVSLMRQLSWTHFLALIPLGDPLKRDFYVQMCSLEGWSVRQLRERIRSLELCLRYLEKYEQVEGENTPIGLILCAGKSQEHVELLQLHKSNIRVADYLTALPSKEVLQAKLHQSIELARQRLLGDKDHT
jgi:hypothetical protein